MVRFTDIFIIYNPVSTGPGEENAKDFAAKLQKALPTSVRIETVATDHAGHGEELAKDFATKIPHCLVISSSGDGGYHDIVNGVLSSGSRTAVTGLLPSGNANDHYNAVHSGEAVKRIAAGNVRHIDVLSVDIRAKERRLHRFAHSYVGIGLTPNVGKELNKNKLNPFSEAWLTFRQLLTNRSVKVEVNDRLRRYETLVFSNINRMAKVLSLSDDNSVSDGQFEVNGFRGHSLISLLVHLLRASTMGLDESDRVKRFSFTCRQNMPVQLDGEILPLANGTTCIITCDKQRLPCIV